jgi:hypothetical protein
MDLYESTTNSSTAQVLPLSSARVLTLAGHVTRFVAPKGLRVVLMLNLLRMFANAKGKHHVTTI